MFDLRQPRENRLPVQCQPSSGQETNKGFMKDSVYHVLLGVMSGEVMRDPSQRFANVAASCVNGHVSFDAFTAASSGRYGRSHSAASLEANTQELLHTDLNPTTQTVRHLAHADNVVFGYGIYRNLPLLHPGFTSEIHRWLRDYGHGVTPTASGIPPQPGPADVDQPAQARLAATDLLTQIVQATPDNHPTTLTDVARHLGIVHRAAAQVATVLESEPAADLVTTARMLGVSPRTLQRRLKDEHTTFETLRSATRLTLAMRALRSGGNLTEVAHEVGYTDSAHFSNSFKQACGMPPTVARLLLSGPVIPECPSHPASPLPAGA